MVMPPLFFLISLGYLRIRLHVSPSFPLLATPTSHAYSYLNLLSVFSGGTRKIGPQTECYIHLHKKDCIFTD